MKISISSTAFSSLLLGGAFVTSGEAACFNSTRAILLSQIENPNFKEFIICPDTTIEIGIPLNADFTEFSADFPLTVLHSNVTIKCGQDGSSANNCAFNGGYIQLITTPNNPFLTTKVRTDNLLVQGIKFTGELQGVPTSTGKTLASSSVGLGAPGENIVFDDCIFEDVSGYQLLYVHRDFLTAAEDFPPLSADVTIKNSVFRNSTYTRNAINTREQKVALVSVLFEDLKYKPCGCNGSSAMVEVFDGAHVEMKDCDFKNVEFFSSLVAVIGTKTEFIYSDLSATDLRVYDMDNRNEEDYCGLGLVLFDKVQNGIFDLDSCQSIFATNAPTKGTSPAPATLVLGNVLLSGIVAAGMIMAY